MEKHKIQVPRTAHYATLGQPGSDVRYCWIACHGYGQLASRFIEDFAVLEAADTLVIAPEGLSRFYWGGFTGNVVASWMTREDRLDEIADYTNFLSTLYDQYIPSLHPEVRIILFGFSQGVATQMRWIMQRFPNFHELVLWAGSVPEDLNYQPFGDYFAQRNLHYIYGIKDEFITEERIASQRSLMQEQGLNFKLHTFDGRHVVDPGALAALAQQIRE